MNDAQLNGAQIGSASSTYGVLLRGAILAVANGVGKFVPYSIKDFVGSLTAQASSTAKFGAMFNVFGRTDSTALHTGIWFQHVKVWGNGLATIATSPMFYVGLANKLYGVTSGFLSGVWTTRVNVLSYMRSSPSATSVATFGMGYSGYGRAVVGVTNTEALFTTFGAAAPDERYIIVQQEDRKVTVV